MQLVIYLLMLPFVGQPWIMAALVLIWGGTAFAFGSPVQTRILSNTQDAPLLAASLIPSAFNIAIAAGAWLGGALIDGGYSYGVLPWTGVVGDRHCGDGGSDFVVEPRAAAWPSPAPPSPCRWPCRNRCGRDSPPSATR